MIDIVFAAKGRPEFTREALWALEDNTDWSLVRYLVFYSEGCKDFDYWGEDMPPKVYDKMTLRSTEQGGPVNIMLDYLKHGPSDVWAKIDNDVIVPPGWLNQADAVMGAHPELSFLGLEPPLSRTPAPWAGGKRVPAPEEHLGIWVDAPYYARCDAIGGVGLMRAAAFAGNDMKQHSTYGGFTDWQHRRPDLVKGWIVPPLRLFLLDRLPFEPWASLSQRYIAAGQQRPWTNYGPDAAALWEWWAQES